MFDRDETKNDRFAHDHDGGEQRKEKRRARMSNSVETMRTSEEKYFCQMTNDDCRIRSRSFAGI